MDNFPSSNVGQCKSADETLTLRNQDFEQKVVTRIRISEHFGLFSSYLDAEIVT